MRDSAAGSLAHPDLSSGPAPRPHHRSLCHRRADHYHRRAGGQSQFSALLELEPKSDRIQSALAYAKRNLDKPLTVRQLAEAAYLSPRQFSRAFRAETDQSPAKAVENLRIEAARLMMEQSRHPIDVIARQTGFADRDRMRRAFRPPRSPPAPRQNSSAHSRDRAATPQTHQLPRPLAVTLTGSTIPSGARLRHRRVGSDGRGTATRQNSGRCRGISLSGIDALAELGGCATGPTITTAGTRVTATRTAPLGAFGDWITRRA
jgi:AraC-like DNA-binding protein